MKKIIGRIRGWRPPTRLEMHPQITDLRYLFPRKDPSYIDCFLTCIFYCILRTVRALLNLWCICVGHTHVAIHEESLCMRCEARPRVCANCDQFYGDHVRGRCLYGFGKFTTEP